MQTQPDVEHICTIATGGQGVVDLVRVRLTRESAEDLARAGWVVQGTGHTSSVMCVAKRVHDPGRRDAHDYGATIEDRRRKWSRIRREHDLLVLCDGLAVPRPLDLLEPPRDEPWRGRLLEEYVDGITVFDLVNRGLEPTPSELNAFARALFALVGGRDGSEGITGRLVAHRDIHARQVIVPRTAGAGLAWDRPVMVDLGVGYSPSVHLRNDDGEEIITSGGLPGATGWYPPERDRSWLDESMDDAQKVATFAAGDLWGWALVVGYLSAGRNLWGVRELAGGYVDVSKEWKALMGGDDVTAPFLHQVHPDLQDALAVALRRRPDDRDRSEVAAALPASPSAVLAAARADARHARRAEEAARKAAQGASGRDEAALAAVRREVDEIRGHLVESDRVRTAAEADRARAKAEAEAQREVAKQSRSALQRRDRELARLEKKVTQAEEETRSAKQALAERPVRTDPQASQKAIAFAVVALVVGIVATLATVQLRDDGEAAADGETSEITSRSTDSTEVSSRVLGEAPDQVLSTSALVSGGWSGSQHLAAEPLGAADGQFAESKILGDETCGTGSDTSSQRVLLDGGDWVLGVTDDDGTRLERRTSEGATTWSTPARSAGCGRLTALGELIVAPLLDDDQTVSAIDATTGKHVWRARFVGDQGPPTLTGVGLAGETFVAAGRTLAMLRPRTGEVRWARDLSDTVCSTKMTTGVVWVTLCSGVIQRLSAVDGTGMGRPLELEGLLARLIVGPGDQGVFALSASDSKVHIDRFDAGGVRAWDQTPSMDGQLIGATILEGGRLMVVTDGDNGIMKVFDRSTGAEVNHRVIADGLTLVALASAGQQAIALFHASDTDEYFVCYGSSATEHSMDDCSSRFEGSGAAVLTAPPDELWLYRGPDQPAVRL